MHITKLWQLVLSLVWLKWVVLFLTFIVALTIIAIIALIVRIKLLIVQTDKEYERERELRHQREFERIKKETETTACGC